METTLLTTKLFIPPARPGLVARRRLLEQLKSALDCSLILVSAPAGSGKTTLVSGWVEQVKKQCHISWVSLDEGDNDPARFWDYFIAALKTLKPAAGDTALSLLHSPQTYPTEAILTALINDLTSIPDDFAVVLDDYHLIKAETIQTGLTFLLDHLPPKMHLVIATRVDPQLPLAHLRGHRTMIEIGSDDLRFTEPEAAGLLKEMLNMDLTAEDISALNTRTEGWAVGLTMAALSIGKRKDIDGFITTFTGSQRYVMDYLVEEVLGQQSDEIQDFFLKTSVLERLTAPLCDSVTGHSGSREMLEKLEQANLFLIPLDESQKWYRYHHLFADLLRNQLETRYGSEQVKELHKRASQWYEENGFSDDAVRHALAGRDWQRAMNLIYELSGARFSRGEWNTLFNWCQMIPEEVLRTNHRLYSQYANVLISLGQGERAEMALSFLEQTAQTDTELQGEVAFFQLIISNRRGDKARSIESAKKALTLLPTDRLAMRSRASFLWGYVHFNSGSYAESWPLMTEAYETARRAEYRWIEAGALGHMAQILVFRGKLYEALEMDKQAIELAGSSPSASVPCGVMFNILYEMNDLEGAADCVNLAIKWSELGGIADNRILGYINSARIRFLKGDKPGALAELDKSDQTAANPMVSAANKARHAALRLLLAIHQGESNESVAWNSRFSGYTSVMPFNIQHIPARFLIFQGEKEAAARQLQSLYEKAKDTGAQDLTITIRVYQALAAATPDEALAFLAEALTLGEPEGFIRSFVDEGKLLQPLLRQALEKGLLPEYTGKLLNIIETEHRQRQATNGEVVNHSQPSRILSERELEILKLLDAGLSNRQIAERLFITQGTVKVHVHNLMEKLDARNRTQAINRSKELKLL